MQIPLDKVCVKSGILCDRCQAKIDSGEYEKWEVDVMRALLNLESKFRELRSAVYRKSIRVGDSLYVVLDGVNVVSRELGKALAGALEGLGVRRVYTISEGSDDKSLLRNLLNVPVLAVNKHYLPDNTVSYVALVPASERRRVEEVIDRARQVFTTLKRAELFVEYEQVSTAVRSSNVGIGKVDKDKLLDALKHIKSS